MLLCFYVFCCFLDGFIGFRVLQEEWLTAENSKIAWNRARANRLTAKCIFGYEEIGKKTCVTIPTVYHQLEV